MGFRFRLASFLVATLALVQAVTGILVYEVTRQALITDGARELDASADAFVRQLDDMSSRVADNVQVLALDYALRGAIAQRDRDTVLSALRNHGRRIGAARMLLIALDGQVEADTVDGGMAPLTSFPFPELLESAYERGAAELVALDGNAYWMVVVPVLAPQPIGLIGAGIPIDDRLLARMQQMSALPNAVELVVRDASGKSTVVARGKPPVALANGFGMDVGQLPTVPTLIDVGAREYVALARRLNRSDRTESVTAVLGYSLDDALQPYRAVAKAWAVLLAAGLLIGLVGAMLIARGVSRPIESLAETARRIEAGDYRPPPTVTRTDEIGHLASALSNMAQAIGEREQRIRHQAGHDGVTGLVNRPTTEAAIDRALSTQSVERGALLMIGLTRVPEIVKTMGHAISDRLMRDVASRLRAVVGEREVARVADSNLSVWLPGAARTDAVATAVRILDALGEPYQEADLAIDLAPAVGVALHPEHGASAGALLQRAEVALFTTVRSEEAVAVYDPATDPHRPERLSLMADLREALDHDKLLLNYQPKLALATNRIDGVEGLVRWQHERRGEVAPETFIGLAEETGNIRRLTRWVLATSIAQAQRWNAAGLDLRVAVNLSARDLGDADLPRRVGELLAIHQLAPQKILLEITESAVMGEPDAAIHVLRQLADQGIDLAIDDFGVGQSSFAYLRRLPVREIKIDKSFVQKLGQESGDRMIVRSIVELGHRLGYRVTAEGVEDRAALDYLGEIGCDHAQGYYIAPALPVADVDGFVAKHS